VAGGKADKRAGRSGGPGGGTEVQYVPLTAENLGDV
jgi:hypothetical protein